MQSAVTTPHIAAHKGQIAERILLPGDPLRAKFIAENWLSEQRQVSQVRNMLAYTGRWKGTPISVMGTGMGMPSLGIYVAELCEFYHVQKLLRVGSCGAYSDELSLYDVLLVTDTWTESSFAQAHNGQAFERMAPSPQLTQTIREYAKQRQLILHEGCVHSSDVFYHGETFDFRRLYREQQTLAVEMEAFALFYLARHFQREAGALLTVSDSLVQQNAISSKAREQALVPMIELALDALCAA